jgi:hypothetical protein
MRWALPLLAILLLTRCTDSGMGTYNPDPGSSSNLNSDQGGAGLQAPLWSDDPAKKTLLNTRAGSSQ